jgi:ABC-2 type transport system permease protein
MISVSQAFSDQAASAPRSLSHSTFPAQVRALGAVIRKEWLHFVRYPSWIFALLIWPVIFPAMYIFGARALSGPDGSGMALFQRLAGNMDFVGYIAVGTTIWMWQNTVLWGVGFSLRDEQMRGTLEANWLTPTFRFFFLVGNSVSQLASIMIYMTVSFLQFGLIYGMRFNINPGMALLIMLVSIPCIYGIAFVFASLVITAKEAHTFVFLVRGLVMIFCGITFPIAVMPGWMQGVARWLPPTYIIQAMRKAMLAGAGFQEVLPELASLALFGVFWVAAGFLVFIWMDRRARRKGTIGTY